MSSDNEGWLAADRSIWHWDGQNWTAEYVGRNITDLSGGGGQVWAVGLTDVVLSRQQGGSWTTQRGGPTDRNLFAVSKLSADDAWAVGAAGTILRYGGGAWQAVSTTFTADLYGVQMLSPDDGYAVGGTFGSTGVIAHWNGISWQQVATTGTNLYSIYMVDSGEGWAVGDGGVIWHGAGDSWNQVASPTTYPLRAVVMGSQNHGWAVGGYSNLDIDRHVLLEYDGTGWVDRTDRLPAGTQPLVGLALAPGGVEGWAVGVSPSRGGYSPGVILHMGGGDWTVDLAGPNLYAVAAGTDGNTWAVGQYNQPTQAYHHDGGAWQAVDLPISVQRGDGVPTLNGLSIVSDSVGWAVGGQGKILRYDAPTTTPTPTGIWYTPTPTPTYTRTSTPTITPTAVGIVVAHLTWQGIPQPDSRNASLWGGFTICVGISRYNYIFPTDAGGFFTIATGLPNGTYNWFCKGPLSLANSGTMTLSGGVTHLELGTMRAGDANNDNFVGVSDFAILNSAFGKQSGDPGYDRDANFNNDSVVNITDLNLMRSNYGVGGASTSCP